MARFGFGRLHYGCGGVYSANMTRLKALSRGGHTKQRSPAVRAALGPCGGTRPIVLLESVWQSPTGTTAPIDTSQASLIVVCVTANLDWEVVPADTFYDSKGNSWMVVHETQYLIAPGSRIMMPRDPIKTGPNHTFTSPTAMTNTFVSTWKGTSDSPIGRIAGSEFVNVASASPGTIERQTRGELVVTCLSLKTASTVTGISSPFTIDVTIPAVTGTNYGMAVAHTIAEATGPITPTWTLGTPVDGAVNVAAFKRRYGG